MESVIDAGTARGRRSALFDWLAGLRRLARMRQAIARLEGLDDDLLRDMGMTRGSFREAVEFGRV